MAASENIIKWINNLPGTLLPSIKTKNTSVPDGVKKISKQFLCKI